MTEQEITLLNRKILSEIDRHEVRRLFSYPECELDGDFIGFLNSYADLPEKIPKDWIIIDFGCYQALQGYLFKDHAKYIGVDCGVSTEWRLRQDNTEYYKCMIQDFITAVMPKLNLDFQKIFAVCSYVPDIQAREMVRNTFPYFRDKYCSEIQERLPERE